MIRQRTAKKRGLIGSIISFLIIMSIISNVGGPIIGTVVAGGSLLVVLASILAAVALPIASLVLLIVIIVKIVNKFKNNTAQSATSVSSKELLEDLTKYFKDNEQLDVDNDIYVLKTNDNNALTSYDVYLNNEYVSNLQTFASAFPSGFNSFAIAVNKAVNPRKKVKKTTKTTVEDVKETIKETVNVQKDCSYYAKSLSNLNSQIVNKQINTDLDNTISYLNEINRIEEEFPECKTKTTKLYQYYLPMLVDILENYLRLKDSPSTHSEFEANEDRLLKTIVLINGALKTISSSLLEDYYTDMKVDMRTLESILKKDGLVDEMNKNESEAK